MALSNDEKWNAVFSCDKHYDGMFYYGVQTTGIFCRPSCKSKTPLPKNILFFDTRETAVSKGFRPCKRCRPDLICFSPIEDVAFKARNVIDKHFPDRDKLNSEIKNLGITKNYLSSLFLNQYGTTLYEYVSCLKVDLAKKLLSETSEPIIFIGQACGFESLSAFYAFFKKRLNLTPKKYRILYHK